MKLERGYLCIILLIIIVGSALRIYDLGRESIWYDESVSMRVAGAPAADILSGAARDSGNPPLYFLLLHYWLKLAGDNDESSARFLSVIFSVLCLGALIIVGRSWFNFKVGLAAAVLLTISPPHIFLAQEARSYSFLIFLTLVSFAFLRRLKGAAKHWHYGGYIISSLALIYTHYYGFFVLLSHFVYSNFFGGEPLGQRLKRNWIFLPPALAFIPWLPVLISQMSVSASRSAETWYMHALALPYYLTVGRTLAWRESGLARFALAVLVVILVAALPMWRGLKKVAGEEPLILIWLGIFVPVLLISLFITPILHSRYLSLLLPAFVLVLSCGLFDIYKKRRATAILLAAALFLLFAGSLYRLYAYPQKEDWRGLVAYFAAHQSGEEAALILPGYFITPFQHYYDGGVEILPLLTPAPDDELRSYPDGRPIADFITAQDGIWLIRRGQAIRRCESKIEAKLEGYFPHVRRHKFYKLELVHMWK